MSSTPAVVLPSVSSSNSSSTITNNNTNTTTALPPLAATNASAASGKKMTSSGSKAADQQSGAAGGGGAAAAAGGQKPPAWSKSSINPITQRASGSPVQNGVKSNGSASQANAVKPPTTNNNNNAASANSGSKDVAPAERLMFMLANFKGLNATLLLKNGDRYTGIFSAVSNGQYVVKMAKKLPAQGKQVNGVADESVGSGPDRTLALNVQDVVDVSINEVRFDKTQGRGQNGASSSFRTDTDISSGWRTRERQLQKWEPADAVTDVDLSLENGHVGTWDQFAAHKKMTGLESTYDENNYTTALNRSRPDYDEASRKAELIAREIEGSSATNAHIAEERGIKAVDDSGLDEEAKYSGVQRGEFKPLSSGGTNRYTPPAMRAPTGQATVPGAPVDPAIISSAFAEPPKGKAGNANAAKKTEETPAAKAEQPKAPTEKEAPVKPAAATAATKPTLEKVAVPAAASKPTIPTPLPSARSVNKEGGATATVEKDVHEAFKEFTKSEKLRVQEHQRSMAKRDKAVKLNDLKKFAQNFKLHTEVPADLLPILARDEDKQRAIKEKAKKNAEDKTTPPRSAATSAAATPSDSKSKPSPGRNDSGPTSPLAPSERQPQRSRQSSTNMGGSAKGPPPHVQQQGQGAGQRPQHGNLGQRLMNQQMNRGGMPQPAHPMPIPDPRMGQSGITSPPVRWDPTKSFVPSASSKSFVPGGSTSSGSSPVRAPSSQAVEPKAPTPGNLFEGRTEGRKAPLPDSERITLDNYFNPIPTLKKENEATLPEAKRADPPNGGLPPPHKTMPTWENLVPQANREKTYKDMFPSSIKPAASPQHIPGPNQFQHQLPYTQHGGPGGGGYVPQPAQQTPRHMVAQPHHAGGPGTPHHYDESQRMQFSQSASSVHPSPRVGQPFMYNPQQQGGPPVSQFQPGVVYGTSPGGSAAGYNMMARQLSNNPQFHGQPAPQMIPGPPGMYVQHGGQMMYAGGVNGAGAAFFPAHAAHMAGAGAGYPSPSPANRAAVLMAPQGSQSGHNSPQVMPGYYAPQGPGVQQIRYGGGAPQHHGQYPGAPQHFPQHQHVMRGAPSGSYPQQQMMGAGGQQPQGMGMPTVSAGGGGGQMGPEGGEEGK